MVAHLSLYRAYRPQTFKEVIGQDHIVGALEEQLSSGKTAHAYLFAGSRGLGKTSVARILGSALGVRGKDLYEIDAASNNSVEDIRSLSENIFTHPFESSKKLYILDEAHMLSKGAWNAFLKTLEEPPPYAVFVLATTELDRVPETVQSRCQVFEFKKPSREGVMKLVSAVSKKEGYTLGPGVAELVAFLADGSYRDALSTLEKVFSVSQDKTIALSEAEKATGAPRSELVGAFVGALARKSADEALLSIQKAVKEEVDMKLFLTLILEEVRTVLLLRHAPGLQKELEREAGGNFSRLDMLQKAEESGITHEALSKLLEAASKLRYAPVPALPLELMVLEYLGE